MMFRADSSISCQDTGRKNSLRVLHGGNVIAESSTSPTSSKKSIDLARCGVEPVTLEGVAQSGQSAGSPSASSGIVRFFHVREAVRRRELVVLNAERLTENKKLGPEDAGSIPATSITLRHGRSSAMSDLNWPTHFYTGFPDVGGVAV